MSDNAPIIPLNTYFLVFVLGGLAGAIDIRLPFFFSAVWFFGGIAYRVSESLDGGD